MKLYKENNILGRHTYMSTKDFLNSDIEIDKRLYLENVLIKGSSRTGKTTKVLIPMFNQWDNTKLYVNLFNKHEDTIDNNNLIVIDMCKKRKIINGIEIADLLLNGESVYLNLSHENMGISNIVLNDIIFNLNRRIDNLKNCIFIAIDELNKMGKIDLLINILKCSKNVKTVLPNNNIYLAFTLRYTEQLSPTYSDNEILEFKKYTTPIDVEKQPIIATY